jgi:hypothetical protein
MKAITIRNPPPTMKRPAPTPTGPRIVRIPHTERALDIQGASNDLVRTVDFGEPEWQRLLHDPQGFLGELAAVDEEHAAVDKARSRAVQPERSGSDLVGSAEPAERDGLHGACLVECAGGDHVADHRGLMVPGRIPWRRSWESDDRIAVVRTYASSPRIPPGSSAPGLRSPAQDQRDNRSQPSSTVGTSTG